MISCLRPDLPAASAFTVSELPHRAKLDQNEAPVDLPPELKRAVTEELARAEWNRYPQPRDYLEAKTIVAAVLGVAPEWVALTVGCDQVIQGAFLLAGGPGRRARWFEPTYPYIALASRMSGTIGEGVVLDEEVDEAIDPDRVIASPSPHLLVLVAPNNPTGGMPRVEAFTAALADPKRLVLVEEAYADFSGTTVLAQVERHTNLLVGRSLSKSLAAACRLGLAIGHPDLIAAFERVYTAPYHLNLLQIVLARHFEDVVRHVRGVAVDIASERSRVFAALGALPGVRPRRSRANFLLFSVEGGADRAARLHEALARRGVRVRDVSSLPGLGAHLRVTVGTREQNQLFLDTLRELLDREA